MQTITKCVPKFLFLFFINKLEEFRLNLFYTIFFLLSFSYAHSQTALDFDGSTQWVGIPTMTCPDSFTFEAWVYNQTVPSAFKTILEFGNDTPYFGMSNGQLTLFASSAIDTSPLPVNTWTFVTCTYNHLTSETKLYVNGAVVATGNLPINTSGIGAGIAYNVGDSWFKGQIADLRIWNSARSDAEVLSDYTNCPVGNEVGLYAYYNFEDGSGSIDLSDQTNNGFDGVLVNFDLMNDWVSAPDCESLSVNEIEAALDQLVINYDSDRKSII